MNRFDPASGRFRVRYAARSPAAAARERFQGKRIAVTDGELWLARLDGEPAAIHLTHQSTLDALGLDDRISTGRIDLTTDPLLRTCQELADALHAWWHGRPPAIVYRTRTLPAARSIAFNAQTPLAVTTARPLASATRLLGELVLHHGFVVPGHWL